MAVGGMMGTSEVFCGQVLMDRQRHIAIGVRAPALQALAISGKEPKQGALFYF